MLKRNFFGNFLFAHTILVIALAFTLSCGEEDDLDKISEEMSNRLTDALMFDDRTIKEGRAPAVSDSPGAPEADSVTAPGQLALGQDFSIVFFSDSVEADDIAGAVVWVDGASKYLEVSGEFNSESASMTLSGYLEEDDELAGEKFSVLVALINNDGEVGNYFEWELEILEKEEEDGDISGKIPLACQRFADWSRRCGDFSYSCSGDDRCYTDEESLCPYEDPDAARTTILAACIKGMEQMFENAPEQARQNLTRMDVCSACMVNNLMDECYFQKEIDPSGKDQSQLAWYFLAPDCEDKCVYQENDALYDALTALKNLIGFNLTPDDLQTSLKTSCDN